MRFNAHSDLLVRTCWRDVHLTRISPAPFSLNANTRPRVDNRTCHSLRRTILCDRMGER
jgi:hypothetical protein